MIILSIETSGSTCGIAISQDGELLAEYTSFGKNVHDKLAAEYIRRILSDLELSIEKLDAVAISAGPGSFTGLRIGGSIAKALCFDSQPKLIAVPTLQALSNYVVNFARMNNYFEILTAVKAYKDFLFYQIFDINSNALTEPIFATKAELDELITENRLLCGNMFNSSNLPTEYSKLTARIIDFTAQKLYKAGEFTASNEYVPMYVQEFIPKQKAT